MGLYGITLCSPRGRELLYKKDSGFAWYLLGVKKKKGFVSPKGVWPRKVHSRSFCNPQDRALVHPRGSFQNSQAPPSSLYDIPPGNVGVGILFMILKQRKV